MTRSVNAVTGSDVRLERVLDSAAELLVRWGYQRVTIDEVARHAGIGKGTVYLHFRTKDALFVTVLLRANRRRVSALADRMLADPSELLPARMVRSGYLELIADPVSRALYLGGRRGPGPAGARGRRHPGRARHPAGPGGALAPRAAARGRVPAL